MSLQNILSRYGIERVSKLMGYAGVDDAMKFILSSLLVEHDTVRNINNLNYSLTFQRAVLHLNIFILFLNLAGSKSTFILLKRNYFEYHVFDLGTLYGQKVVQTELFFLLF